MFFPPDFAWAAAKVGTLREAEKKRVSMHAFALSRNNEVEDNTC
jgi:hypothetical protein